jgi:hypothetical protein
MFTEKQCELVAKALKEARIRLNGKRKLEVMHVVVDCLSSVFAENSTKFSCVDFEKQVFKD